MNKLDLIQQNAIILDESAIIPEYMTVLDSEQLELYTEPWRYNRQLDLEKVHSIQEYVDGKAILDTTIHMCFDVRNDKLIVFDGNHRREALTLRFKANGTKMKACCYVYVINDCDNIDNEIVKRFKVVNQMSPIPDIYYDILEQLDEPNKLLNRKDIIEKVFTMYKKQFNVFFSLHPKCRRPHFNTTTFKDLCNSQTFETEEDLLKALEALNKEKEREQQNLPESILKKCKKYGFYLFI